MLTSFNLLKIISNLIMEKEAIEKLNSLFNNFVMYHRIVLYVPMLSWGILGRAIFRYL